MASISFNLPELFERTFGYKTTAFSPEFAPVNSGSDVQSARYTSGMLGQHYYLPVAIAYDAGGAGNGRSVTWQLPHPVVAIKSKKNIVETVIPGRNGTVKELIGRHDYEIDIKGFMVGRDNEFPEDDMTRLRTIYELNKAVEMRCALTDIFLVRPDRGGSDNVVITSLEFPSVTGIKNVKPYVLTLVSDAPFNLVKLT
jgi:hypothetical protein